MKKFLFAVLSIVWTISSQAGIADRAIRAQVGGIDLIAYPMAVENVVTFSGSLPAGDSFAPKDNVAVPTLVGEMLDKGTTRQDKYAIAAQLENVGARIGFSVDGVAVTFKGKCLGKDLPMVLALLAEQLRTPAFAGEELDKLKKQLAGDFQRALESTDFQAGQAFAEAVFPEGHPNYQVPVKAFLEALGRVKREDLQRFHQEFYGPKRATLVVVGSFEEKALRAALASAFGGWTGGRELPKIPKSAPTQAGAGKTVFMAEKTNVSVLIGQSTGLRHSDSDTLALRVATAVFGSGFTGRLMANVRDKEGLTYGIGSAMTGDTFNDGDWRIMANFSPALLDKGLASTRRQLDLWHDQGVTADECERVKERMVGSFKVGLATTDGMAGAILNAVQRGYELKWLDEYPARVGGLTLEQVNGVIKKYLDPKNMVVIQAGTVPVKGQEQK